MSLSEHKNSALTTFLPLNPMPKSIYIWGKYCHICFCAWNLDALMYCFIYICQNKFVTNHYLQSWTAAFGNSVIRKGLWHLEQNKFDWVDVSHVEEKQRDPFFTLSLIRIFRQICLLYLFFMEVGTHSYYCNYNNNIL